MTLFRCIAFAAAAVALAGCCTSSDGCYVAVPGVPTAWDGAGPRPSDGIDPRDGAPPRRQSAARVARPKPEVILGPITDANGAARTGEAKTPSEKEKDWAQREAADREADAKLARQLMICRDCLPAQ
jgi:hypothetical protein